MDIVETTGAESDLVRNITISRDATSGSGFEQDKLMALRESSSKGPRTPLPPPPPPPAEIGGYPTGFPQPGPVPVYRDSSNMINTWPNPGQPPPMKSMPSMKPVQNMPYGQAPGHSSYKSTYSSHSSRKRAAADQQQLERLSQRVRILEQENDELKTAQGLEKKPPRYQVFHTISSDPKIYLEPPTWEIGADDEFRLKGHLPVQSKDRFLQTRREIAFSVEKTYSSDLLDEETKKMIRQGGAIPEAKAREEQIVFETQEMNLAVKEFIEQNPRVALEIGEYPNLFPLQAPYLFWYGCRSSTVIGDLEPDARELMALMVGWIEQNYLAEYEQADNMFASGFVTLSTMQYLVKPDDVVVTGSEGMISALLSNGWAYPRSSKPLVIKDIYTRYQEQGDSTTPKTVWIANGWAYNYDGEVYKKPESCEFTLSVRTEDEQVRICDLGSYPLRYADEDMRQRLEKRGGTFWSYCRSQNLVSYQDDNEEFSAGSGERIMLDERTYQILHEKSQSRSVGRQYISETFNELKSLESPDVYLFPPKIRGYNLRQKKWLNLDVDRLSEVVWNKKAFEHLVVEEGTKELVQALVTNQIAAEKSTDLIQNKGNGLIMLLHGGPGTGKTFTAESVAELAEKPLFRVTCGDVGTQPEEVEKYLESVLYLGKIWGCVVLLDEADVFLEQRTLNDLTRNALVSVFLRVLEYHEGILILTSNRVGTFDEAFKSRIQLALHYDSLNRIQRSQIWANFLNRLKGLGEKNIDYVDVEGYINQLADHEMNGREIRNAITTARQLAQFKNEDMSYEHLKHVITVASKFDKHLGCTRGASDDGGVARDDETMSRYTWADWKKLNLE
jgi:hypothetical protein